MRAAILWTALAAAAIAACSVPRDRELVGEHPAGWGTPASSAFHGRWLKSHGYPLADCKACHGDDYAGGPVGVSCTSSGCHTRGVESCGTCHGGPKGPLPASGAHEAHAAFCEDCHPHVTGVGMPPTHVNGIVDLVFSGVAVEPGKQPSWNPTSGRCADTHCHGATSPPWFEAPATLGCDGCHGAPPASHVRWARVASTPEACATCHPVPPDPKHIDGVVELRADVPCDTCHGAGPLGAPPVALDGSSDPSKRGTGAHARHLDASLPDRVAPPVPCESCHTVPSSLLDPGHLDTSAPADVHLADGGTYDARTGSCVVGCHGDQTPGPKWTDDSGAARACDACHGAPPASHVRWARVASTPASCATCHPAPPGAQHVDGVVEVRADVACDTCHGAGPLGAPPVALDGTSDPSTRGTGAHARHLDPTLPDRIGRVVPCAGCHTVPSSLLDPGHLDATAPADVLVSGGAYDASNATCVVGCHWNKTPGPTWTDDSGAARACDACHGFPPQVSRTGRAHPHTASSLSACLGCHPFDPSTHVDGFVDLL